MKISNRIALAAGVAVASFGFAAPASAQATRTWVSGVGDDVNPCSRTAPCKTFAGAISKTAAGGEINCLDPGGYGTITITKSITIDCTGTFGSILNSGGINGVNVNDSLTANPGTIDVVLRGLTINGAGSTPGLNGIRVLSARSVKLQDVFIQNQKSGNGISLQPSSTIQFQANDVTVTNGNGGVLIQPSGAGSVRFSINDFRAVNNSGAGVRLDSSTTSGFVRGSIENSEISTNGNGGIASNSSALLNALITDTIISGNNGTGIAAAGFSTTFIVGDSTITGNTTGISTAGGAVLRTYGDNRLDANPNLSAPVNGTFTGAALPKR